MTSKLTRERLLEIAADGFLKHGESKELARMALAAMDSSESIELPLDYLQGHKDGLEWASQLAEANHPETGDWLYNDPIELAKAIRKGPDMPPAQPAADSEPVAEVVSIYGDPEAFGEREIRPLVGIQQMPYGTKLYLHAQPAPVVQCPFPCGWDNLNKLAIQDAAFVACGLVEGEPTTEAQRQAAISNNDRLLKVISACRAAMLAAAPQSTGSEPATVPGKWIPVSDRMPGNGIQVLVSDVSGHVFVCHHDGSFWVDFRVGIGKRCITHWMPLPAAPQEVNHG